MRTKRIIVNHCNIFLKGNDKLVIMGLIRKLRPSIRVVTATSFCRKIMRAVSILSAAILSATLAGCVSVPVWVRDVTQLDKMGKGLTVAEVDKVFGRSTILASDTVKVGESTYLFRHYDLTEPTGRITSSTVCQKNGGGCMTTFSPVHTQTQFAVIFVGTDPKLLAWGKLDDLYTSTDPAVVAVRPQLQASYSKYRSSQLFPGMRW